MVIRQRIALILSGGVRCGSDDENESSACNTYGKRWSGEGYCGMIWDFRCQYLLVENEFVMAIFALCGMM